MSKKGKRIVMGPKTKVEQEMSDGFPLMEYSVPKRILASPMSSQTAIDRKIEQAFSVKDRKSFDGYWVKEPVGELSFEYWMPKDVFDSNHIRTDSFTIGEMVLLLTQGANFTRPSWDGNMFIRFMDSSEINKDFLPSSKGPTFATLGTYIAKVVILVDPLLPEKPDIVLSPWNPCTDDLFAKDFQVIYVDYDNLFGKKETKK